ncbi:response regulator [Anaerohalosphaera lusitana]|nr:response regulator [Anaerohalosphaera lusitana]
MSNNILIVDDSVLMRAALKRTIDMVDLEIGSVFEAGDGEEALAVIEKERVDLILSDLNMPNIGGVELVEKLKHDERYAQIPIVVISTESSEVRVEDLMEQGVSDFLHKPFRPNEFRDVLIKNLGVCHGNS